MLSARLAKLNIYALLFLLFILPFQTRCIYAPAFLNGGFWEYGAASIYGSEILLLLIIILTSYERFSDRVFWQNLCSLERRQDRRRAFGAVAGFITVLIFAAFNSRDLITSLTYLGYFIDGLCLAVVIVLSRASWQQKAMAFWCGGILQSVLAIYQFIVQHVAGNKWLGMAGHSAADLGASVIEAAGGRWLRAYGSFSWPNALGIYLAVAFLFGLALYLKSATWPRRILLSVGQVIILVALFFSFSRAAWVSVGVGVIVMTIVWLARKEKIATLFHPLLYLLLTATAMAVIFWPLLSSRILINNNLERRSFSERYQQLNEWRKIITISPVFGIGPGAYTFVLHNQYSNRPAWQYAPIHNIYLLMAAEWGVALVMIFAVLLAIYCRRAFFYKPLLLGVVLAWLAFGFFDHWTVSLYGGLIFSGAIFGLLWTLDASADQE